MRRLRVLTMIGLLALPVGAFAQTPQNREPMLLQLIEDMKQARAVVHPSEIEAASCKVQVRDLQQQLQAASERKDVKEKK